MVGFVHIVTSISTVNHKALIWSGQVKVLQIKRVKPFVHSESSLEPSSNDRRIRLEVNLLSYGRFSSRAKSQGLICFLGSRWAISLTRIPRKYLTKLGYFVTVRMYNFLGVIRILWGSDTAQLLFLERNVSPALIDETTPVQTDKMY